jgi:hypothetical protein
MLLQRAHDWYARSADEVTGLARVRISKRMAEIAESLKKHGIGG